LTLLRAVGTVVIAAKAVRSTANKGTRWTQIPTNDLAIVIRLPCDLREALNSLPPPRTVLSLYSG
jgi:hypothetical protein